MTPPPPTLRTTLRRGWRRRCPRCGEGRLFRRWVALAERCSACDLVYEPSPGATWGFWVVGDRLFVVALLLPIYLGLALESWWLRGSLFAAVVVAFVATMPHRQGVCTALDYLTRVRWGDPAESVSPAGPPARNPGGPAA